MNILNPAPPPRRPLRSGLQAGWCRESMLAWRRAKQSQAQCKCFVCIQAGKILMHICPITAHQRQGGAHERGRGAYTYHYLIACLMTDWQRIRKCMPASVFAKVRFHCICSASVLMCIIWFFNKAVRNALESNSKNEHFWCFESDRKKKDFRSFETLIWSNRWC